MPKKISKMFWRKRRSLRMPRRNKRKKGAQKEKERFVCLFAVFLLKEH